MRCPALLAIASGAVPPATWHQSAAALRRAAATVVRATGGEGTSEVQNVVTYSSAVVAVSPPSSTSPEAPVDLEYSGEWVCGLMEGSGSLVYAVTGESIRAPFKNGRIEGHAIVTAVSGVSLEGQFHGLSLQGRAIIRQPALELLTDSQQSQSQALTTRTAGRGWYDGDVDAAALEASLRAGTGAHFVRHGVGETMLPNGDSYTGQWAANVPDGEGTYTYAASDERYVGQWARGLRHGHGSLSGGNLDEYIGGWRDGMRSGRGVQRLGGSGDVLEGEWANDAMGGTGKLTTGQGDVYDGGFVASLREGYGECSFADGAFYRGRWAGGFFHDEGTLTGIGGALCEGTWHRGEMVGYGKRIYDSGEGYVGEFARGLRHGRGNWHDAHGATYEGGWADDLRDGEGTYVATGGVRQEGTWKQDRLHGPGCREVAADGSSYEGSFENGLRGGSQSVDLAALRLLMNRWSDLLDMRVGAGLLRPSSLDALNAALAEIVPVFLKEESASSVHGYGQVLSASGEAYEGFFRDGLQTGPGLWLSSSLAMELQAAGGSEGGSPLLAGAPPPTRDGKPLCVLGTFKGGQLSGVGMAMLSESIIYAGGFLQWRPCAHGVIWLDDGSTYRGQWENGLYHGVGELRAASPESAQAAADAVAARKQAALLKEAEKEAAVALEAAMRTARTAATYNPATATISAPMPRLRRDPATGLTTMVMVPSASEHQADAVYAAANAAADAAADAITQLQKPAEVLYQGAWIGGLREGEGRAEYVDGGSYSGQWKADEPHGRGTLVRPRDVSTAAAEGAMSPRGPYHRGGSTFTGEMVGGVPCGTGVLSLHESGDAIEGEWTEDGTLSDAIVRFAAGGQYDGDLDAELRPHGEGRRAYTDGARYSGSFLHGVRDGHGVCRELNGDEYDGGWLADERHGHGTLRYANGGVYEGSFSGGARAGHGLMRFPNGSSYEGQWHKDAFHGIGNLYHSPSDEGNDMYGGHWQDGKEHGHGVYSYAGGASFSGEHAHGARHGEGVLTLRDGSALSATWVEGELRGQGTITYLDGCSVSIGLESARPREGVPELTVRASTTLVDCEFQYANGDVYTGEFAQLDALEAKAGGSAPSGDDEKDPHGGGTDVDGDGLALAPPSLRYAPHGQGTLATAEGCERSGAFVRGHLTGEGRAVYADGAIYEGQFAESVRAGNGTMTYADGAVYKGAWHADGRHGRGLLILAGGDMYSGRFVSDVPANSGTIIYSAGGSYDGELRMYRRHGWGVFQESAGYKYEGDWSDDERSGYGREVRENGDVYEGQFSRDRRHGRGRFISVRGEEYDGGWLDGKRDGQGVSIVLPIDEAERQRQRVNASLLVHRDRHFLQLQGAQAAGRS